MSYKYLLELSEVQIKVINELEILTDVLASTFMEIGRVVKPYFEEIKIKTDSFTKNNTSWKEQAQCWDLRYFPFRDLSSIKRYKIESLGQIFCVTGQCTLEKVSGKTSLNSLEIQWGFKYNKDDPPYKFFFVDIQIQKTPDGIVFSETEYKNIARGIKETIGIEEDDFYDFDSPNDGGAERFYVWLDFKYSKRLQEFFQICRDELIKEFLSRISDKESIRKDSQKTKR